MRDRSRSRVCAALTVVGRCRSRMCSSFSRCATEDRSHARKLQGVDTPSQKRYVGQLYQMLEEQSAFCPLPQPLATTTAATELTKTAVKEGEAAGNNRAAWARDEMRTWSEVGAVRVSALHAL